MIHSVCIRPRFLYQRKSDQCENIFSKSKILSDLFMIEIALIH